jgi:hypothetical protein
MGGHAHTLYGGEIRVSGGVEDATEQGLYRPTAILSGRQADAVDNDQIDPHPGRTRILVWRIHPARTLEPAIWQVDLHSLSSNSHLRRLCHESGLLTPPDCGMSCPGWGK